MNAAILKTVVGIVQIDERDAAVELHAQARQRMPEQPDADAREMLALRTERRRLRIDRQSVVDERCDVEVPAGLTGRVEERREPPLRGCSETVIANELTLAVAAYAVPAADRQLIHREQAVVRHLQESGDKATACPPA